MKNIEEFKNSKGKIFLFTLITILSIARFLYLGTVPGLHEDEAFYGIKTYIMMNHSPFTLNGFNAYSGPLISYLRIPFYYLMGVNIFSLRIPIVILSLISSFFIYRLLEKTYNRRTAMIGVLLFLTMPWCFIYTRFADETHTTLMFFAICGLYYLVPRTGAMHHINTRLETGAWHHLHVVTRCVAPACGTSKLLAALFLGMGVFNHIIFIIIPVVYFVYFFLINRPAPKINKAWIIFFVIFLSFLFLRLFLTLNARFIDVGKGDGFSLDQTVNSNFIYKFLCSIPHFMNMLNGGIFYQRTTGNILAYVVPLNSVLFIISFLVLLFRYKYYLEFKERDRMFLSLFILNYLLITVFSIELSLRYFLVTLMFSTILIAIFIGTIRIKDWIRTGLLSFIVILNCIYIGYNYIYSFRQSGGRLSTFWAGNFFEYSNNFIDSTVLYDYLKKEGIRDVFVPSKFIRLALIFLDLDQKRLNIKARDKNISTGKVYFIFYKGDRSEMYIRSNDYSILQEITHLNNHDIFLLRR